MIRPAQTSPQIAALDRTSSNTPSTKVVTHAPAPAAHVRSVPLGAPRPFEPLQPLETHAAELSHPQSHSRSREDAPPGRAEIVLRRHLRLPTLARRNHSA